MFRKGRVIALWGDPDPRRSTAGGPAVLRNDLDLSHDTVVERLELVGGGKEKQAAHFWAIESE